MPQIQEEEDSHPDLVEQGALADQRGLVDQKDLVVPKDLVVLTGLVVVGLLLWANCTLSRH